MAGILTVNGHMYDSAVMMACTPLCPDLLHETAVTYCNPASVHCSHDSVACGLLHICYHAVVILIGICVTQRHCDRMSGMTLHMSRQVQKFVIVNVLRVYGRNLEHTLCQRSGLIEHHGIHAGQLVNQVGTLNKDTLA